ncbi:hypothetical protein NB311A_07503 [Nitrobacter sp. Nb-311A]|nr:hypothetical protein NB311A_07503 [Nitrobacter sp. Nb-311A]
MRLGLVCPIPWFTTTLGAFPLLIESKAGLSDFDLTRFLHANRVKPEDMLRSKRSNEDEDADHARFGAVFRVFRK